MSDETTLLAFPARYLETRSYTADEMDRVLTAAVGGNPYARAVNRVMVALSPSWKLISDYMLIQGDEMGDNDNQTEPGGTVDRAVVRILLDTVDRLADALAAKEAELMEERFKNRTLFDSSEITIGVPFFPYGEHLQQPSFQVKEPDTTEE